MSEQDLGADHLRLENKCAQVAVFGLSLIDQQNKRWSPRQSQRNRPIAPSGILS
jgi:hypothetical protein